ncbi:lipopolysaccharide transport system ATP-binding protein [Prevotella sp. khp1]|uniref:ABC transporter ATP-binding protein n=1 Tax=Prevotellaceae TaxID=171552 RepID=UPI00088F94FE|nr:MULTISPECIES: ABC transporter ATP-binding protein [Prevotellaceae]QVJ80361.1 ABC transporter ATP-binding protein [Xylanibacter ruminicola]SDQ23476.1 lipopolysaccharide transport system ATP-binding protein [Prevotella sp. khp1]
MKAIEFNHVGKQYRLGVVSTGTFSHDLNRWWTMNVLGKEDPYLKIGDTNVRSTKGESDFVWALKDISFSVEQGDVMGIIGKNGAGKSTLLKLLSRVTAPSVGEINVCGRIASLLEVGTGFHPEMTGRENIYMNGAIMGMTKAEVTRKLDEIIDFSGCERYIDTPVKRYSSGMKVRLGFAVAAHLEPEILVVDEVLAVGDAEFQKKAIGKMQDVSKGEGRTVLFVSHNMAAVRNLCQKGVVLRDGMTDFIGTADEAIDHYLATASTQLEGQKLMTDYITDCKNFLKINEIQINHTPYNSTYLTHDQEVLDIQIKGHTIEPMKCEIKMIIKKLDGTPMASLIEGRYTGKLYDIERGEFTIQKHIRLPKYIADGNYLIDINLHEPYVQNFFYAQNCMTLHIEGFYNQFAKPIVLSTEGFIGLESV